MSWGAEITIVVSKTANEERLYELRDRAAIALRADIAFQIAAAREDVEVVAKYQELNDPVVFWAYVRSNKAALCL